VVFTYISIIYYGLLLNGFGQSEQFPTITTCFTNSSGIFLKEFCAAYSTELVGEILACCTELTLRLLGLPRRLMEDIMLPKKGRFRR
jgi:hypothetical protein